MAIVFGSISSALTGDPTPGPQEGKQESVEEKAEEEFAQQESTTEETTEETLPEYANSERTGIETTGSTSASREPTQVIPPPPATPEEQVLANLGDIVVFQDADRRPDPSKATADVSMDPNGCLSVLINYRETGDLFGSAIPSAEEVGVTMRQIYEAIYGDAETRAAVCNATAVAYVDLNDAYGNNNRQEIYRTSLSRDLAERVNWSGVPRLEALWTVEYEAPQVASETARENAQKALDCAVDEGLFDVDMFC